jgi:hypothetical protein
MFNVPPVLSTHLRGAGFTSCCVVVGVTTSSASVSAQRSVHAAAKSRSANVKSPAPTRSTQLDSTRSPSSGVVLAQRGLPASVVVIPTRQLSPTSASVSAAMLSASSACSSAIDPELSSTNRMSTSALSCSATDPSGFGPVVSSVSPVSGGSVGIDGSVPSVASVASVASVPSVPSVGTSLVVSAASVVDPSSVGSSIVVAVPGPHAPASTAAHATERVLVRTAVIVTSAARTIPAPAAARIRAAPVLPSRRLAWPSSSTSITAPS